jgi:alkaline phosphatase D
LLDVRPDRVTADFRTTPNPAQTNGVFRSQGQWVIRSGVPGVQKA